MTDHSSPDPAEEIRQLARRLASGASDPYDLGWQIWGVAFANAKKAEYLKALWLIWGSLTDWVENKPDEESEALEAMRRAAREWLEVESQPSRRKWYCDHWVYE